MSDGQRAYAQAIEFLYGLQWFGARLGLERAQQLAALSGNPEQHLRFIHVAGTNGKGSTCAMLESIYRAAGYRVGLFSSPHLVTFRERMQVNRLFISEADVVRLVQSMQSHLQNFSATEHPTFFEVITVMALEYFRDQRCDVVIWETGLGGRMDATNIVKPLASVITTVQWDHEKWLGDTLEAIALEKAGIIKDSTPVIVGALVPEALDAVTRTAREKKAPFCQATDDINALEGISPALAGMYQRQNAAIAIRTVQTLQSVLPVPSAAIRSGLESVDWPGRFQLLELGDDRRILLDGAHNPAGAEALAASLKSLPHSAPLTLILGILQDKDWKGICRSLVPLASRIGVVPVQNERTSDPTLLLQVCREINPAAKISSHPSLGEALAEAARDRFVVITGSLYLIGEALQLLQPTPPGGPDERGLNAWSATGIRR
jgi:dihydrofolate synthase/folylpolyglutamate synthase